MLWIAGHVVQTRAAILKLLGEPFDTGWGDLFARGVALQDRARYPSRRDLDPVLREITVRLHTKLAALDDQQLASPATVRRCPALKPWPTSSPFLRCTRPTTSASWHTSERRSDIRRSSGDRRPPSSRAFR